MGRLNLTLDRDTDERLLKQPQLEGKQATTYDRNRVAGRIADRSLVVI